MKVKSIFSFAIVEAFTCRACIKQGETPEHCYNQTCPTGIGTCLTTTSSVMKLSDDAYKQFKFTWCAATEYCHLIGENSCFLSRKMLEYEDQEYGAPENCTTSCSPEPANITQKIPSNTLSCVTCFDNGHRKTDCVKRKCPPGFAMCKNMSYTGMSLNENITFHHSEKGCAPPAECKLGERELKEFIRQSTAQFLPDVVINNFAMQCSSTAALTFPLMELTVIAILISMFF